MYFQELPQFYSLTGIIVILKIYFYFISCRQTIPKYVKLYFNEKVSETKISKRLKLLCSWLQSLGKINLFLAFCYMGVTVPVTALLYILGKKKKTSLPDFNVFFQTQNSGA